MSTPPAGTTKKKLFSQHDYLAPLPLPTGQKPSDCLNIVWRKNDVFVDIGCYSIGSAVMLIWLGAVMWFGLPFSLRNLSPDVSFYGFWAACVIIGIPTLVIIYSLFRPVPRPFRFNRQRREVCVIKNDGEYWIVPWESVVAAATRHTSISQAGRNSMGLLFIGVENPDPDADEDDRHLSMGFNCGGGKTAMALWECVRSYMEIGPEVIGDCNFEVENRNPNNRNVVWFVCCSYADGIRQHIMAGDVHKAAWLIFCIVAFNAPLAMMLQEWKLAPPPDLDHPDIIEWSKPLPPEQWAKPSPELVAAIAEHQAQLADRHS